MSEMTARAMPAIYPSAKKLSKHAGEWVVAVDGKVVAHGKELDVPKIVDRYPDKVPFVLRVPEGERILKTNAEKSPSLDSSARALRKHFLSLVRQEK